MPTYEIRDASGLLLAVHERHDRPDRSKTFSWHLPDGTPGLGGLPVSDLPLYAIDRLDGLASSVVVVEGEKAADALLSIGIAAVGTVTGASSTPGPAALADLTGFRVTLWPDADVVGRRHMERVAAGLWQIAPSMRLVEPPDGVERGWDAADAVAEGREVAALLSAARSMDRQQGIHDPRQPDFQPMADAVGALLELTGEELLRSPTPVHVPSIPFLGCSGYIIQGWSHLVSGYPRVGKTELLVSCVAEWLSLGYQVLYITEEPQNLWEARLKAEAGRRPGVPWGGLIVIFGLGADPADLLRRASSGPEAIVALDAARNLLGISDENDNSAVARVLNPWVAAARTATKTLVVAHHQRKGGGDHGEGIAGGHAFLGIFDIALEVVRDRQAPHGSRRLVRPYARLLNPRELLYERTEDGTLRALGDPDAVRLDEVEERLLEILTSTPRTTSDCQQALGDPRPSLEQVRLALTSLARAGRVDRDPPIEVGGVRGRTVRWGLWGAERPTSNGQPLGLEVASRAAGAPWVDPPESEEPTIWAR